MKRGQLWAPPRRLRAALRLLRDALRGQLSERRIAQPQLGEKLRRGEFRLKAGDMGPPFSAAYAPTFCR